MSKRGADKQLTHDNWDQESDEEEPGQFHTASEDVLKKRVIKKAKRRIQHSTDSGAEGQSASASPFAAFAGFSIPKAAGASNPFGFLAATKSGDSAPKSSDSTVKPSSPAAAKPLDPTAKPFTPAFGRSEAPSSKPPEAAAQKTEPVKSSPMSSPSLARPPLRAGSGAADPGRPSEYHRQLQALNRSLLAWLQSHVEKNPLCILTPVFRDYETHLQAIEKRCGPGAAAKTDAAEPAKPPAAAAATSAGGGLSFGTPVAKSASASPAAGGGFSFGAPAAKPASDSPAGGGFCFGTSAAAKSASSDATPAKATGGFSFGAGASSTPAAGGGGFSFGLPKGKAGLATSTPGGFSFGSSGGQTDAAPPATAGFSFGFNSGSQSSGGTAGSGTAAAAEEDPEESEEPPVPVVNTVKEDDAVYSKKCKLFYKKDGSFAEKGVGMLYLKPCGDKFQCLVRADTNLGNILLNIKLNKSIPTQRMGKNNVMMACVPNPPIDPKATEPATTPVPLLIRVKTGDDADELLRQLDDHKR